MTCGQRDTRYLKEGWYLYRWACTCSSLQNHQVSPLCRIVAVSYKYAVWEGVEGQEDTFQQEHLGDHLIGLMRSDVHLDIGSGLKQLSHSR